MTHFWKIFGVRGTLSKREFWIYLAAFFAIVLAGRVLLSSLDSTGAAYFWLFPAWLFVILQGLYGVYGKRLHDSGRGVVPVTGMIAAVLLSLIVIMLIFGGADYFAEYSQYERKAVIDPAEREAINARYQARMGDAQPIVTLVTSAIFIAFTAWVGTRPPKKD